MSRPTEGIVALIFYYLGFMAAGDVAAYLLGSAVEYEWGPQVSLIVFPSALFYFPVGRVGACRVGHQAEGG